MERGVVIVNMDDYADMVKAIYTLREEAGIDDGIINMQRSMIEEFKKKAELLDKIADSMYEDVCGFGHKGNVIASVYYDDFKDDLESVYEGYRDKMVKKAYEWEKSVEGMRKEKKDED